jgi:hypothetical protein
MNDEPVFTSGRETPHRRPRGYADWRPQRATRVLLDQVEDVLDEYVAYLPLTIRQIFYRLVGAHGYEKTENAYARLCEHLNRARRARLIDFDDIRDDGVVIRARRWFEDEADFWDDTVRRAKGYERDKQNGQPYRIELWCEAQGMMPQLELVAGRYSVPVYSCGGFASLSAVRQIVDRAADAAVPTVFLHVGDYDPSGESIFDAMTEDAAAFLAEDRLLATSEFIPRRVALAADQVADYDLPTAPPKASDSRSARWRGETCQLEALPPDVLADIVEQAIQRWMHPDIFREHSELEKQERVSMLRALPRGDDADFTAGRET